MHRCLLIFVVAIFSMLGIDVDVNAKAATKLTMTIAPLQCTVDVVDDGTQSVAYVDSSNCRKGGRNSKFS